MLVDLANEKGALQPVQWHSGLEEICWEKIDSLKLVSNGVLLKEEFSNFEEKFKEKFNGSYKNVKCEIFEVKSNYPFEAIANLVISDGNPYKHEFWRLMHPDFKYIGLAHSK